MAVKAMYPQVIIRVRQRTNHSVRVYIRSVPIVVNMDALKAKDSAPKDSEADFSRELNVPIAPVSTARDRAISPASRAVIVPVTMPKANSRATSPASRVVISPAIMLKASSRAISPASRVATVPATMPRVSSRATSPVSRVVISLASSRASVRAMAMVSSRVAIVPAIMVSRVAISLVSRVVAISRVSRAATILTEEAIASSARPAIIPMPSTA